MVSNQRFVFHGQGASLASLSLSRQAAFLYLDLIVVLEAMHEYITMAKAEPIGIFVSVVSIGNTFEYEHNLPQDQIGGQKLFWVSYLLKKKDT